MAGNTPNISKDSFGPSNFYDQVTMQQGVPIPDSDLNEGASIALINDIMTNKTAIGNARLPGVNGSIVSPFSPQQGSVTTNNFDISGGWAMVEGVLVPTKKTSNPPPNITYDDYEDNYICVGTISSVSAGNMVDVDKNWSSSHNLVGCRVRATSGPGAGTTRTISARVNQTTLSLTGGTGTFSEGTVYTIHPPALTTPSGSDRDDEVYVAVWWDDINENEDPAILNSSLGIETCHRLERRWCVRVAEGGTTPTTANWLSLGFRYMKLATLHRLDGDATITTAMISDGDNSGIDTGSFFKNKIGRITDSYKYSASAITSYQVESGRYYVGTVHSQANYRRHFQIIDSERKEIKVGSDGRPINISAIRDSTNDHDITSADVDSDGFVERPYIVMDFSDTVDTDLTGSFYTRCVRQTTNAELTRQFGAFDGHGVLGRVLHEHANNIYTGDLGVAGSPNYDRFYWAPSAGEEFLQPALDSVFSALNALYVDNRAASADWKLDWRTNQVSQDSSVAKSTVSTYHKNNGYIILNGGYINGSNNVIAGTGTGDVTCLAFFSGDVYICTKAAPTAGADLGDITSVEWDQRILLDTSAGELLLEKGLDLVIKDSKNIVLYEIGSSIEVSTDASLDEQHCVVLGSGLYAPRLSFTDRAIWLLTNASWDNTTKKFTQLVSGVPSAGVKLFAGEMQVLYMEAGASPWDESDWTADTRIARGEVRAKRWDSSQTINDDASVAFDLKTGSVGLVVISSSTTNSVGVFRVNQFSTTIVSASSAFSVTKDNAGTLNFYRESGSFYIQNKTGIPRTVQLGAFTTF